MNRNKMFVVAFLIIIVSAIAGGIFSYISFQSVSPRAPHQDQFLTDNRQFEFDNINSNLESIKKELTTLKSEYSAQQIDTKDKLSGFEEQKQNFKDEISNDFAHRVDLAQNGIIKTGSRVPLRENSEIAQSFKYDNDGRLIEIMPSNHHFRIFHYDRSNHLIAITKSEGEKIELSYDSSGDLNHVTNSDKDSKYFIYDGEGNITKAVSENGTPLGFPNVK